VSELEQTDGQSQPVTIKRCGYVAIAGRPNVGKSTLLNMLVGQKISITSRKPQTTRHHLLGISNKPTAQILYLDTPGIQTTPKGAINRHMNREALIALADVDVVIFMIDATGWTEMDEVVREHISKLPGTNIFLVINKTDRIKDKKGLIPLIQQISSKQDFAEIIPMSARTRSDVNRLERMIIQYLPESLPEYPDDQITNRSSRFLAAEFIREKLMQHLGDELPYKLAVTIDKFDETTRCIKIYATIWVEQPGQKKIIIGKNGAMLKVVGEQARKDMEKLFDQKVYLKTWVKIKHKWTSDEQALKLFNYD